MRQKLKHGITVGYGWLSKHTVEQLLAMNKIHNSQPKTGEGVRARGEKEFSKHAVLQGLSHSVCDLESFLGLWEFRKKGNGKKERKRKTSGSIPRI